MKKTKLVQKLIILLFFLAAGGIYTGSRIAETMGQSSPVEVSKEETPSLSNKPITMVPDTTIEKCTPEPRKIIVHICGEVKHPGIVELPDGSRIADAVELAGGAESDALLDAVNLAEVLMDGERVYIPSKGEVTVESLINAGQNSEHQHSSSNSTKVNLNLAEKEQLMTLPGIGEVKAKAILAYRSQHGSFATITEVKKVEGIKEAVYEKIKDKIIAD